LDEANVSWGEYPKGFWASEWYKNFENTTDKRKELTWRNRFGDVGGSTGPAVYNFYSSTEEVLRAYTGENQWTGWDFGLYSWAKQEKFKGKDYSLSGAAGGSSPYCGWGVNIPEQRSGEWPYTQEIPFYVTIKFSTVPATIPFTEDMLLWYLKLMTPAELGEPSNYNLVANPFFCKKPAALFEAGGSAYVDSLASSQTELASDWSAVNVKVKDWLLAKAFPALTLPMGANPCGKFGLLNNNIDMSTQLKPDNENWPDNRIENGVEFWYHSDYKDLAYPYVYKFYGKIVELINE